MLDRKRQIEAGALPTDAEYVIPELKIEREEDKRPIWMRTKPVVRPKMKNL